MPISQRKELRTSSENFQERAVDPVLLQDLADCLIGFLPLVSKLPPIQTNHVPGKSKIRNHTDRERATP